MLLFVDQPKTIKILRIRDEDGEVKRDRIGAVQKNKLEIADDLSGGLEAYELEEVQAVVMHYRGIQDAQRRLDVARFPEIVRNVVEHLTSGGLHPVEHRLLVTALSDGVRQVRKLEREEV